MTFVYKNWERFCARLEKTGIHSIPAKDVTAESTNYLVLKHDVETDVAKAYALAQIEHKHGHRGSYYVQAYLMNDSANIAKLSEMKEWGHEISYHYDVMDSNKGDLEKAISEFDQNVKLFEKNGFEIVTVCQHGNPIVDRVGYTSNRDFFRSEAVQKKYPDMSDIMVNYKNAVPTEYIYFSDAGRKFKLIYDPINNDVVNSDDKNIAYDDLNAVFDSLSSECGNIISTHPHRYSKSAFIYTLKAWIFKLVKAVAKILVKIPLFKKIMSRYYHLAKKL